MNTWFTADTHFGHKNIIKYCNRPFGSVEEMDDVLIQNWNSKIKKNDVVYFLGDLALQKHKYYLSHLNGKINIIRGNHDKLIKNSWVKTVPNIVSISDIKVIRINGAYITLSHYALRNWCKSYYGQWHLYAHSHGRLVHYGKSFDVGVDSHDYYPINFGDVQKIIKRISNGQHTK